MRTINELPKKEKKMKSINECMEDIIGYAGNTLERMKESAEMANKPNENNEFWVRQIIRECENMVVNVNSIKSIAKMLIDTEGE